MIFQNILNSSFSYKIVSKYFQSQQFFFFSETQNYQFLVLFFGKLVKIFFHDLCDLVWFEYIFTATYRNMNPFTGILMFLILFWKHLSISISSHSAFLSEYICLVSVCLTHTHDYLQNYEPIHRHSSVSDFCVRNIQVFL